MDSSSVSLDRLTAMNVRVPWNPASTLPRPARTPFRIHDVRSHSWPARSGGSSTRSMVDTKNIAAGGTDAVPSRTVVGMEGTETSATLRS